MNPRQLRPANTILQTVLHDAAEVRLPATEIVVDVNDGYACLLRAALQPGDTLRHRQRLRNERLGALEFEVVDHIDEQQGDSRRLRHVAMQVGVLQRDVFSQALISLLRNLPFAGHQARGPARRDR